jgi:hypothetical protein
MKFDQNMQHHRLLYHLLGSYLFTNTIHSFIHSCTSNRCGDVKVKCYVLLSVLPASSPWVIRIGPPGQQQPGAGSHDDPNREVSYTPTNDAAAAATAAEPATTYQHINKMINNEHQRMKYQQTDKYNSNLHRYLQRVIVMRIIMWPIMSWCHGHLNRSHSSRAQSVDIDHAMNQRQ